MEQSPSWGFFFDRSSVCTHWMCQYYVLYLAWWWLNGPKHVAKFLIFLILINNVCCVYWLIKLLYYLLEKLTGFQLLKKFPAFYGTRRFITAVTSATLWLFRNMMCFYGEELLLPRPTPKLEDHPLSAVRDCLFNIFAATLHIGGRSSIRNLRMRHTVVTGTHFSWGFRSVLSNVWLIYHQKVWYRWMMNWKGYRRMCTKIICDKNRMVR